MAKRILDIDNYRFFESVIGSENFDLLSQLKDSSKVAELWKSQHTIMLLMTNLFDDLDIEQEKRNFYKEITGVILL